MGNDNDIARGFYDRVVALDGKMASAASEDELRELVAERRRIGEEYREWHLKRYGWACGMY